MNEWAQMKDEKDKTESPHHEYDNSFLAQTSCFIHLQLKLVKIFDIPRHSQAAKSSANLIWWGEPYLDIKISLPNRVDTKE